MITTHRIGNDLSAEGRQKWHALDATTLNDLPGEFVTATKEETDRAIQKAVEAFLRYRDMPAAKRAAFLRAIADEIEALGDTLVDRVKQETALGDARIRGERARTTGHLRMFADLITEGSWVDAIIDTADSTRTPPRPDLRRMLFPLGPVVVFSVSNFPLAYSTAGGDTVSALAAGCPVIVKAHEGHPGTNALIADAIITAAQKTHMPDGVFSTLYAKGFEVGAQLVSHPSIAAVGFTGSHSGGRALFDLAAKRASPIPVFAEMSSINPIFLLPEPVSENAESIATQISASVNNGAGQFCTCPGLIIAIDDMHTRAFIELLKKAFDDFPPQTMLNNGIRENYSKSKDAMLHTKEVDTIYHHSAGDNSKHKAGPAIASVQAKDFLADDKLQNEVFGPFTMIVLCTDLAEMIAVARSLHGQLTATIHCTTPELILAQDLVAVLREKAGRLVFNGVPTGVDVCNAMVHGGPYPATTDSRFTAVGSQAIKRWVRPVVFQNSPAHLLPDALKDGNPLGIWRMVDGQMTK